MELELTFELGMEVVFELLDFLVPGAEVVATPAKAEPRLVLTGEIPSVALEGVCAFIGVTINTISPVE